MDLKHLNILLADDDTDDCLFFKTAIEELDRNIKLTILRDGEQLMNYLFANSENLPDVLFLDLSMPRKTGFECLCEIKEDEKLKNLKVAIFSTSFTHDLNYEQDLIYRLLSIGAFRFFRKPNDFNQLKLAISNVLNEVAVMISKDKKL